MRLNRIDESVADQIMMSVASMSPVALVGTMTAGAILGDKFLKFLRGDELAQMKRKIERDPAAFEFVEDMRADRKFKKLKRIVNKLARDVKKNPDDPEFKTLFKKAAAELNAYVQTEYKRHSKKFKDRYRGTKVGRQAMRQMMGIKEDAQLDEAESLSWNKMKDSEKKELVDLARVSPRAAFMDWKEIPSSMKARLAKYLNQSTKGEYRLVEDQYGPYGGPPDPFAPLEFDPRRYMDDDGDGIPNYDDPDYPRDPRYYPGPHPDDPMYQPMPEPEIPDWMNPNIPGGPYSNPFGVDRPSPGWYDPYFDPYVPVLPSPADPEDPDNPDDPETEPYDPPTEPVIPGTDPSSPFPFGLPFPYRPKSNPFAPGEPFEPEIVGTQTESMKLDKRVVEDQFGPIRPFPGNPFLTPYEPPPEGIERPPLPKPEEPTYPNPFVPYPIDPESIPDYDPYNPPLFDPYGPETEPVIPGTDPKSPFPFGLPYPYPLGRNPFRPGEPFGPILAGTQMESMKLDERAKVPTYVIDRRTKKIVHGPTDTADAKLYLDKQITPRKFMIRQIRGAAKKIGDSV